MPALDVYARGYLVAPELSTPPSGWVNVRLTRDLVLSHDPRVSLTFAEEGQYGVWIVGQAIDLRSPLASATDTATNLLRDLRRSREIYLRNVGHLAGRHVIVDSGPHGVFLIQDASGARSTFYSDGKTIVGSHVNLVGDLVGAAESTWRGEYLKRIGHVYPPGDATARVGIRSLTPNVQLNLTRMTIDRFYPRTHLTALSVDEVADILIGTVRPVLRRLCSERQLLVSLTAGRDSRLTLALLRELGDDVTFFTYHSLSNVLDSHREDVRLASFMAEKFGLKHIRFDVASWYDGTGRLSDVAFLNNPSGPAAGLIEAMRDALPPESLHLKSQHYEIGIGRSDARLGWGGKRLIPEVMESLSSRQGAPRSAKAVEEYRSWASRVGLSGGGSIRDYDLFYWEHRMGTWGASQLSETDVAVESMPVINARSLYEAMLSVSLKSRRESLVARTVINRLWPELLDVPVNGADWRC